MKNLVILSLFVRIYSTMATEVNLRVFGYQDNNSMITLCPRDKFMLVAECTVIESRTLVWLLRPLLSSTVGVNFFSDLGESRQEGVTFVLAKKSLTQIANENFYISQVQLHTDHIRDSIGPKEKLFIRCEADSSTDYALITLTLAAGDAPSITSGNRKENTMSVSWTTNIFSIVNIAVIAKNVNNGVESSIFVGGAEREASLIVTYPDPYNVTVTVFDQCQQNLRSEAFYIEALPINAVSTVEVPVLVIPQNTLTTHSSSTLLMSNSSVVDQLCNPKKEVNNAGLVALYIVLPLLLVLISSGVCVLVWILFKRQSKDQSLRKASENVSLEGHLHASNVKTDSDC